MLHAKLNTTPPHNLPPLCTSMRPPILTSSIAVFEMRRQECWELKSRCNNVPLLHAGAETAAEMPPLHGLCTQIASGYDESDITFMPAAKKKKPLSPVRHCQKVSLCSLLFPPSGTLRDV